MSEDIRLKAIPKTRSDIAGSDSGYFNEGGNPIFSNLPASISNQEVHEAVTPIEAPDGGYGWVICFACFWLNCFTSGMFFALGAFLSPLIEHFEETRASVTLIGSLLNGVAFIVGPFISLMVDRFGCRPVCIVGCVVSAFGFSVSVFAPNLPVLILTHGVIGGVGMSMIYIPSMIASNYYFVKKRALACGIGVCGQGVGYAALPPLCGLIVRHLGWEGVHLFFAIICVAGLAFAVLLKPLNVLIVKKETKQRLPNFDVYQFNFENVESFQNLAPSMTFLGSDRGSIANSFVNIQGIPGRDGLFKATLRPLSSSGIFYARSMNALPSSSTQGPMVPEDGVVRRRSADIGRKLLMKPPSLIFNLIEDHEFEVVQEANKSCFKFPDPRLLLFLFSNIPCSLTLALPFNFVPDMLVLRGICDATSANYIITSIGLSNMVGQILIGALVDLPWVNSLLVFGVSMACCSATVVIYPFCETYIQATVASVFHGFSISCIASLPTVVLVDMFGLDLLTSTFGYLCLVKGISFTLGGPITGSIYDISGSYDWCFYVGACLYACGSLLFFIAFLLQRRKENE